MVCRWEVRTKNEPCMETEPPEPTELESTSPAHKTSRYVEREGKGDSPQGKKGDADQGGLGPLCGLCCRSLIKPAEV